MPDFGSMGLVVIVSSLVAALLFAALAWLTHLPQSIRWQAAWVLSLAAGAYAGCGLLGEWPRWPALEDRERLLTILLPLALAVEIVATTQAVSRRRVWLLRAALAAAATPILLYNTVYLVDLAGPGSAEWSKAQAALVLSALAGLLLGVWALLARLQARQGEQAVSALLSLACLAAGMTVMLSGYFTGGLLGLPLGGALAGAALTSWAVEKRRGASAAQETAAGAGLGIGLIGLFSVIAIGRFFGSLPTTSALCLLLAPLLAWALELPRLQNFNPSLRTLLGLLLVAAALALIVAGAYRRFNEAFAFPGRAARAMSGEVYMPPPGAAPGSAG